MNQFILRSKHGPLIFKSTILLVFVSLILQRELAAEPNWWSAQGVINLQKTADDYAAVNLGQLKNIAKKAAHAVDISLSDGAGVAINNLINSWNAQPGNGGTRDDYSVATVGQVKAAAKIFHDRLAASYVIPQGAYPWGGPGHTADDYAIANIGQLKAAFAFSTEPADVNHNGIPDLWELNFLGNLNQTGENDFDGDGLTDVEEWQDGTDPTNQDTDNDGVSDGQEITDGSNPASAGSKIDDATIEDPDVSLHPYFLYAQAKVVSDIWYTGGSSNVSTVTWGSSWGGYGSESHGGAPVWQSKVSLLGDFPDPQYNRDNIEDWNSVQNALSYLAVIPLSDGVGNVGIAFYNHVIIGASTFNIKANWNYFGRRFTYRKKYSYPTSAGSIPAFEAVKYKTITVNRGQTTGVTIELGNLDGSAPTDGKATSDYSGRIDVVPSSPSSPLIYDSTDGHVKWVTVPLGESVTLNLGSNSFPDQIVYKVQGSNVIVQGEDQGDTIIVQPGGMSRIAEFSANSGLTDSLLVGVIDGSGTMVTAQDPVIRFDIKKRKDVTVTVQPIGLRVNSSSVIDAPYWPVADLEQVEQFRISMENYLNSVFEPQVNMHVNVKVRDQVYVAYDKGLGSQFGALGMREVGNVAVGSQLGRVIVGDRRLSMLHTSRGGLYSDEEKSILDTPDAAPDPEADITIYWVAGDCLDEYKVEDGMNLSQIKITLCAGNAGKAMNSYWSQEDPYPRVIWVVPGLNNCDYMLRVVAHELGHALGDIGHTMESYEIDDSGTKFQRPGAGISGYSPDSDNCLRLMTGMSGPRKNSLPVLLNKFERDRIAAFVK